MTFRIEGEHNTATVHTNQSRDDAEDGAIEQIQSMVDHEALAGDDGIHIMPDFHWGSGAVIGFTMPLHDRVVPNIVGVDIGCGMTYAQLNGVSPDQWDDEGWAADADEAVREAVPMGFDVNKEPVMHIVDDFPWELCSEKLDNLLAHLEYDWNDLPLWFQDTDGFGGDYFKLLCRRTGYDVNRAICSLGSLGGGNHFIEFAESQESGDVYCIVHSGSRGIGAEIAKSWQDRATTLTYQRRNYVEIPTDELVYFEEDKAVFETPDEGLFEQETARVRPDSLSIDREAVLADYDGEAIDGKFGQLKQFMAAGKNDSNPLDWLEGEEALGYYIDMIFAQTYASVSRSLMVESAADAIGATVGFESESVHNYIDFEDCVMRKGATPAHEGQTALIPYNMKQGSILAEGTGNPDWNKSAPHGAGRVMSRTEAENTLSADSVEAEMESVYTTNIPLDEAPASYKPVERIESVIGETAEITDRLVPLHNLKA